jgi:hypothetical protein
VNTRDQCDGCLGSGRCWICLGTGILDRRRIDVLTCHRCYGTGRCTYCQSLRMIDLVEPALIHLDAVDEDAVMNQRRDTLTLRLRKGDGQDSGS